MAEQAKLLLIETSGRNGFVAVAEGPTLREVRRLEEARRHARDLAPATVELLAAQGWKARDLNGVVVGLGPGSYTGLRVGVMSAKTLAYAVGCAPDRHRDVRGHRGASATRDEPTRRTRRRPTGEGLRPIVRRDGDDWRPLDALRDKAVCRMVGGAHVGDMGERARSAPLGAAVAGGRSGGGRGVMGTASGDVVAAGVGAVHGRRARRSVRAGTALFAAEFRGGATTGATGWVRP